MTENDADIRTLVETGDTIAAVRLHRERHGGSLIDARAAIEAIRWSITQARGGELDTTGRDVDDLLRRGDRIGAIRRHREATGCSLKEAMAAIEARTPAPRPGPAAGEEDVDAALRAGQKILAIKRHREKTGCGLAEARDFVEARAAALAGPSPAPVIAEPPDVNGLQPELDRLISAAAFIPAVQHYQARTGASVEDAIAAVDARRFVLMRAESAARTAVEEDGLQPELDRLIRAGEMIQAIKHYRRITGLGLRDCKDAVEARRGELQTP
jgi:ribosomal protein L7/L12